MDILIRPIRGRMLTGVAAGVADIYGLPVNFIRALFVVGFLAQPVILLLYLLLAISMPSEDVVVSHLTLNPSYDSLSARERFERLSDVLLARVFRTRSSISPQTVAFAMVAVAAAMEIPRLEGIG